MFPEFLFYFKVLLFHSITYPIKRMSMDLVRFCLMVSLMMPSDVDLSVMISVACCVWPISPRVVLSASISLESYNNAPHSASADDDIMLHMMVDMTIIDPFGWLLSSFVPPM